MIIFRPFFVDMRFSQPCVVMRFVSLARGKLSRIFVRTESVLHAPPTIKFVPVKPCEAVCKDGVAILTFFHRLKLVRVGLPKSRNELGTYRKLGTNFINRFNAIFSHQIGKSSSKNLFRTLFLATKFGYVNVAAVKISIIFNVTRDRDRSLMQAASI